jgi:soluble lytic murein transglycosylase-like protein
MTRRRTRLAGALVALATISAAGSGAASPTLLDGSDQVEPFAPHIAEASARFGLPAAWIAAVLRAESGGDARAVSRAGAMGLMQLMPATWSALRRRLALGDDPFDPRDNILAGAAYLRELHDLYGSAGFLAAYNAGPGRYEAHLRDGRPLPAETRAYLADLAPRLVGPAAPSQLSDPSTWRRAPVFVTRTASASDVPPAAAGRTLDGAPPIGAPGEGAPADGLFVRLSAPRGEAAR